MPQGRVAGVIDQGPATAWPRIVAPRPRRIAIRKGRRKDPPHSRRPVLARSSAGRLRNLTAGFVPTTNYISYRLDLTWINESQLQRIDPLINQLPRKSELPGRPLKSGVGLSADSRRRDCAPRACGNASTRAQTDDATSRPASGGRVGPGAVTLRGASVLAAGRRSHDQGGWNTWVRDWIQFCTLVF